MFKRRFTYHRFLTLTLLVFACEISHVYGIICNNNTSNWYPCSYDEYCCGLSSCCKSESSSSTTTTTTSSSTDSDSSSSMEAEKLISFLLALAILVSCYRCYNRRTTDPDCEESPATVVVNLPPQQDQPNVQNPNTMSPYPNSTPNPATISYPQPSPYPQPPLYPQPSPYPQPPLYPQPSPYPQQCPVNPYYAQHQPPKYFMAREQHHQPSAPAALAPPY